MNAYQLLESLLEQNESEILDFKRKYSGKKEDFLHDVLSMFNSTLKGEKHIVYGVDDNRDVVGLDEYLDSAKLNNFLSGAPLSDIFPVQVVNLESNGSLVSIVIIPENSLGPVVMKAEKYGLKKDHVYVRVGDTNIGKAYTADPRTIYKIFESAKGSRKSEVQGAEILNEKNTSLIHAHGDIHDVFHSAIRDYENWDKRGEFDYQLNEHVEYYFYKFNMDFTIKVVPHLKDFREPWAQDAIDPRAFSYFMELRYKGIKINEIIYVSTDGAREENVVPNQKFYSEGESGGTYYYYYVRNSLRYDLNSLLNKGFQSFTDRANLIKFPVFKSEEEALSAIEEDFKSEERLLLSYSLLDDYDERYNYKFRKFERYPKFYKGNKVPANRYEETVEKGETDE